MILYLDTSAFLKLYLDETGSRPVRDLVAGAAAVYTHLITYAEMRAALARAIRMGRITETELRYQIGRFEDDWLGLAVVDAQVRRVRSCLVPFWAVPMTSASSWRKARARCWNRPCLLANRLAVP